MKSKNWLRVCGMIAAFALFSIVAARTETIASFPMDTDPGWTYEGQWCFGMPAGGGSWWYDPTAGHTGRNVVGYNLDGDYGEMAAPEYARTQAINCANYSNVQLAFWRVLIVEVDTLASASIQASRDGVTWVDIWANAGAGEIVDGDWTLVSYDLSAVADGQPTVFVRWGMGPVQNAWGYPGWNIDDVAVTGDRADALVVLPATAWNPSGPKGGPFAPASIVYTLANASTTALNWAATTSSLCSISKASGTLGAGASTTLTVSLTAAANSLAAGAYDFTYIFANASSGASQVFRARLTAQPVYYANAARIDDSGDGLSWGAAKKTIQAAINATTSAHYVWAAKGKYTEVLTLPSGAHLVGGFAGTESAFSQRNVSANPTILSGGTTSGPVVGITAADNCGVDGFTITDGLSASYSGGVYLSRAGANVTIANCAITSNVSSYGGGIYCESSYPTITNCSIWGNRTSNWGGGLYIYSGAPVLSQCQILANVSATAGGGAVLDYSYPSISDSLICGNQSTGVGGGIYSYYYCEPVITSCVISGNIGSAGGGLYFNDTYSASIVNSIISGNAARSSNGGGIYSYYSSPGFLNCTISSNHLIIPSANGAGLYSVYSSPICTNTLFENCPRYAIYEYSINEAVQARYCLFYNNPIGDYRRRTSAGYVTYSNARDINWNVPGASNNVTGDPLFAMNVPAPTTASWTLAPVYDTALRRTTMCNSAASYVPGALRGQLINPNLTQRRQALVADNTTTAIIVWGDATAFSTATTVYQFMNYHLTSGSAALDRGCIAGAPANDMDGDARPGADGKVDIGVDEAPAAWTPAHETSAPISIVRNLAELAVTAAFDVPFLAVDDASGVQYIQLYYRLNGGAWTLYPGTFASSPAVFNSASTGGDGYYEFYSRATDNDGNVEPAHAGPDAGINVVTSFTASQVYVDLFSTFPLNGGDWAHAMRKINHGLLIAQAFSVPEVWVAEGTYAGMVTMQDGVALYGGFRGTETALVQRDMAAYPAIIDAAGAKHALLLDSISSAVIDGFTIRGGNANGTGGTPDGSGGGVYARRAGANVTLAQCMIRNNYGRNGGGLYITSSSLSVINSVIALNSCTYGGGVYADDGATPVFTNCSIANNSSSWGGGLWMSGSAFASLLNSRISGNFAYYGGGLYGSGGGCNLTNTVFSANNGYYYGGAVYGDVVTTITNCAISHNYISYYGGGGILGTSAAHHTILNTIFEQNNNYAVSDNGSLSCFVAITNCLFYNNPQGDYNDAETGVQTGALAIDMNIANALGTHEGDSKFLMDTGGSTSGTWTLAPAYNSALDQTALWDAAASFTTGALRNCLIAPNADPQTQAVIFDNTTTMIIVAGDVTGYAGVSTPYALVDYHLTSGSAALDRGAAAGAPATDFDSDPRPGGDGLVDIGPDEAPDAYLPPPDGTAPVSMVVGLPDVETTATFPVPYLAADGASGVKNIQLFYRHNGGAWTLYPGTYTASPISFNSLSTGGDGYYEFYSIATDNAGNGEAAPATPDDDTAVVTSFTASRVYVDKQSSGTLIGDSWTRALHTGAGGLIVAQFYSVPEIWVAQGVYPESIAMISTTSLYGGFRGGASGEASLAERGDPFTRETVLDSSTSLKGGRANHTVTMIGLSNARIDGFTLTGAQASDYGGGIVCRNSGATNTIINCLISGNSGGDWGGGIACVTGSAAPVIQRCKIQNNSATYGGGIAVQGGAAASIFNCEFTANTANSGGALLIDSTGIAFVTSCVIARNFVNDFGGGICCYATSVTVTSCVISGNHANNRGGGIYIDYCSPSFINCQITGCFTYSYGAAAYLRQGSPSFMNCTVSGNQSNSSAGGFLLDSTTAQIVNTIFEGNIPHGIEQYAVSNASVRNCLFHNNTNGAYYYDPASGFSPEVTSASMINALIPNAQNNYDGDPKFFMNGALATTGTWTANPVYIAALNQTVLTDGSKNFVPGSLKGRLLRWNDASWSAETLIMDNTTTVVYALSDITAWVASGDRWRLADYHLTAGSAALDRATSAGAPANDIEGTARPGADGLFDIGAHEGAAAYTPPPDTVPPFSVIFGLPDIVTSPMVSVPYYAGDGETGIKNVRLYYRRPNGVWTQYGGNFTASPIAFNSSTTGGDGYYEFYSVATDLADNVEPAPDVADDGTLIISSFPGPRVYVNLAASGVQNGKTWADAVHTVALAMFICQNFNVPEIWIARGTYPERISMRSGQSIYGGFSGTESALAERNWTANETTLDGGAAGSVVTISNITTVTLDGLTLLNGSATNGGGVLISNAGSAVTVANCMIRGNYSSYYGGGIYCYGSTPLITNTTLCANTGDIYGGGIYCQSSSAIITSCVLVSNGTYYYGGGVFLDNASHASITSSVIVGNTCYYYYGGGALISATSASLINCLITGNSAPNGGGISLYAGASPQIVNCTISRNAGNDGVYCSGAVATAFINCLFEGNNYGVFEDSSNGASRLINCLFWNNTSGDFYDNEPSGAVNRISAVQINAFSPGCSGNITGNPLFIMDTDAATTGTWTDAPVYDAALKQTALWDSATTFALLSLRGRLINCNTAQPLQALILDNTTTCIFVASDVSAYAGAGSVYQLIDYRLADGSAALDRGAGAGAPSCDIEGTPRPGADGLFDIGAYEAPAAWQPPADTNPPISLVAGLPDFVTTTTFNVTYFAGDNEGYIQYVNLYYRHGGGAWTQYGGNYTASPVSFNTAATGGDGYYEFYSIATDMAGNVETSKTAAEDGTLVITSFAGPRVYVNQAAAGEQTGKSWTDAVHTVAHAMLICQNFNVPEIWVARGTYAERISMLSGQRIYGGFAGSEASLAERAISLNETILDGGAAGSVVTINSVTTITLDGFTITNGNVNEGGGAFIWYAGDSITIANCSFINNTANYGGAVRCVGCSPLFINCMIAANVGAYYGGGFSVWNANPVITSCSIVGNYAANYYGGGFYSDGACNVQITSCLISANSANSGGGVYCNQTTMTLANCVLSGNSGYYGSALYINNFSPQVINCTFSDNTSYYCGAVFCYGAVGTAFTNCLFEGNQTYAVYENDGAGASRLINCLFYNNTAGDFYDNSPSGAINYISAAQINAYAAGCSGNVTGAPMLWMDSAAATTGTWTADPIFDGAINRTLLFDASQSFIPGALKGRIIRPNDASYTYEQLIMDNTTTAISIRGDVTSWVGNGNSWRLSDCHLANGSVALDRGTSAGAPVCDMEGTARPGADGKYDIGAYEAAAAYTSKPDVEPPFSETHGLPAHTTATVLNLQWWAGDNESGINYIELVYRKDGGAWTTVGLHYTASPIAFDTAGAGGNGFYEFYTIATDNAGNVEAAPATPDDHTLVISSFTGTRIYMDVASTGPQTGESWATPLHTFQDAFWVGQAFNLREIWVAQGTYPESIALISGYAIYGGFAGTETLLSERDIPAHETILDGTGYYHVVVMDTITTVTFDGFTVTGGNASSYSSPDYLGGGLYLRFLDRSVIIAHCVIRNNQANAYGYGGGVFFDRASPELRDCEIRSNYSSGYGGGLFNYDSNPLMVRCIISGNTTQNHGAGVYGESGSTITLLNCMIYQNQSSSGYGGGIYINSTGFATITSCVISANGAVYYGGLALYYASAEVTSCVLSGNWASYAGGGVACISAPNARFTNCLIAGNTVTYYGGAGMYFDLGSNAIVTNCNISGNYSTYRYAGGGGVYLASYCALEFTNCIFSQNSYYAIFEANATCQTKTRHCLFFNNPDGDYYASTPQGEALYTGAIPINLNVAGALDNTEGDPLFFMNSDQATTGVWTADPVYDPMLQRTALTDSAQNFTTGALKGRMIRADEAIYNYEILILDNDATRIFIPYDSTDWANNGDPWRLMDYHLTSGSAALDRGTSVGAPLCDIEGAVRPGADGLFDIGAYEATAAWQPPDDVTSPSSEVRGLPDFLTTAIVSVTYVAGDDASGMRDVQLFYLKDSAGSWTQYGGAFTASPITFDTGGTGGDGFYEFYTIATDNAGNVEAAPEVADDSVLVITTFTAQRVYVDQATTGVQTGDSWANALNSIHHALSVAQAYSVNEIWVARGAYPESIAFFSGLSVYGGFAGGETSPAQRDVKANETILDATGRYHAVAMSSVTTVTLDGFTITNANANGGGSWETYGGGVFLYGTDVSATISNCIIRCNNASSYGGGIYLYSANAVISSCTIAANSAGYGGGVFYDTNSGGQLINCIIGGNWANPDGGGVYCYSNSNPEIANCVFTGNGCQSWGGAMRFYYSNPTLVNNTISRNFCNGDSGGILLWSSNPTFVNNIFDHNSGYAIYEYDTPMATHIGYNLFHGNASGDYANYVPSVGATGYTGGADINAYVDGAERNVTGDPMFAMDGAGATTGTWSDAAVFDPATNRMHMLDSARSFPDGSLKGLFIGANMDSYPYYRILIVDNTSTAIIGIGDNSSWIPAGVTYQLMDFHLTDGSMALDRALVTSAPLFDIESAPRPGSDALADIGAYEAPSAYAPPADNTPPMSQVVGLPDFITTSLLNVTYVAGDSESGLRDTQVYYRKDGGAWTTYGGPSTASPIPFDARTVGGDGFYEFYTRARDYAGNVEDAPATPDGSVLIVTAFAASRVYVDLNSAGAQTGASWANALHTIAQALSVAQAYNKTEIWVARGTYPESIAFFSGLSIYGGFASGQTSLTQRDVKANETILDATGRYHAVTMNSVTTVTLDGFTLANANANGGSWDSYGGGVLLLYTDTSAVVSNCVIRNNSAASNGGGIFLYSASAIITSCTIANNSAGGGGGVLFHTDSGGSLTNCLIGGNWTSSDGGGVYCYSNSNPEIANCVFTGNGAAGIGGAIQCYYSNPTIVNNTFSRNFCNSGTGSGILLWSSNPAIVNNIFDRNSSYAIYEYDTPMTPYTGYNLFFGNGAGDYANYVPSIGIVVHTGAVDINAYVDGAERNVTGDPLFAMDNAGATTGTWSDAPIYDALSDRLYLFDSSRSFAAGSLKGRFLGANMDSYSGYRILIVDNTSTAIISVADNSSWISAGVSYQVMDFHLMNGSTALDRALVTSAPAFDIESAARPGADGLADIGAYEASAAFEPPADLTSPMSQVVGLPDFITTSLLDVAYVAGDGESGLRDVQLYYRKDGGAWTPYGSLATASPIPFDARTVGGDGFYEFYTRARDYAGNVEDAPLVPDDDVLIVSQFAASRVYVDLHSTGTQTGDSWPNALHRVNHALFVAQTYGLNEIWVARGTYKEGVGFFTNLYVYGGFAGTETALSQRDWAANETILDGNSVYNHVVWMDGIGSATLDGFTVTGGYATGVSANGGGVFLRNVDATVSIVYCRILNNRADNYGGGVSCDSGSPIVANCVIGGNTSNSGGGISANGPMTILHCQIVGNSASSGYGGGVYCFENAVMTQCVISGNSASVNGGGIYFIYYYPNITNCLISGNNAGAWGGGAFCYNSNASFTNCTISSNSVSSGGGGIFLQWYSAPIITNTLFEGNTNFAIYDYDATVSPQTQYCLFYNNPNGDYLDDGGTPYTGAAAINASVAGAANNVDGDPRFVMNTEVIVTGIWTTATLYNSELHATMCVDEASSFVPGALKGRLINPNLIHPYHLYILDNTTTAIWTLGDASTWVSSGSQYQLIDYHLTSGSAAVDAATSAGAPLDDLDGQTRPVWGYSDIGCYEWNPWPLAPYGPNPADGAVEVPIATSLQWIKNARTDLFDLYLWNSSLPRPLAPTTSGLTGEIFVPLSPLEYNTTYSWQLIARNIYADQAGPVWSFATRSAGTVAVQVTPVAATWSFKDGNGVTHAGAGSETTTGIPTGDIVLTWDALANYDSPEPVTTTQTLEREGITTFTGDYTRHAGTVVIEVTPDVASWGFTDGDGGIHTGSSDQVVTGVPTGVIDVNWFPLGGYDTPPATSQTLAKNDVTTFTVVYARHKGTVVVDVTPGSATWSFTDGDSGVHAGAGSQVTTGVPTGDITITYNALADYDAPASQTQPLAKDGTATFTAAYTRHTGTVVVDVTPAASSWSFTDGDGVMRSGTGPSVIPSAATGLITLTWNTLPGYIAPAPNPTTATLVKDGVTTFTGVYTLIEYTLATFAPHGSVIRNPDLTAYSPGTTVTLTAIPDANYKFASWTGDVLPGYETDNPLLVTMDRDRTLTATMARDTGIVVVATLPVDAPWSFTDGDGVVHSGTGAAVTTGAATGLITLTWGLLPGYAEPTPNPTTATLAKDGVTNFTGVYTWIGYTLTALAAHGSVIRIPDLSAYPPGTTVTVTVIPDGNYQFVSWTGDVPPGHETDNPLFLTMDANKIITANLAHDLGTVVVDVTPASAPWSFTDGDGVVHSGTGVSVTTDAATGLIALTWGSLPGYAEPTPNPTTATLAKDGITTFTGVYTWIGYTLTTLAPHGAVTRNPDLAAYPPGTTVTLTAIPDANYQFASWTGDVPPGHETDNPLLLTMDANKIITANLSRDLGTVVVDVMPTTASWSFTDGDGVVHGGTGDAVTTDAATGLITLTWDALPGYAEPMPNPTTAPLAKDGVTTFTGVYTWIGYVLTTFAAHGSVTRIPDLAAYPPGTTVTLTAMPDANYHFISWTGDVPPGHETDNPLIVTMDRDRTLTATIARDLGTVVVDATPAAASWSFTDGDGVIRSGTGASVTTNAATGLITLTWGALPGYIAPAPNPTTATLAKDGVTTFTGVYTLIEYSLTTFASHGAVTRNPDLPAYPEGTTVTLTAMPDANYHFISWTGDVPPGHETDNPLIVTMDRDRTLTATIARDLGTVVVDATPAAASWSFTDGDGVIRSGTGASVTTGAATGLITLTWSALPGYIAPAPNPTTATLAKDGVTTFTGVYTLIEYSLTTFASHGAVTRNPDLPAYPEGTTVTLTAMPDANYHFISWSGDVPPGYETDNPLIVTMDRDRTLTATIARDLGTVVVDVTPAIATWSFTDGDGVIRSGTGASVTTGAATGLITLTWSALPGYDAPAPNPITAALIKDGVTTFTGVYARQTGTVAINVSPASVSWSLVDADAQLTTGSGSVVLTSVPIGLVTLTWQPLTGYDAPTTNPMTANLAKGDTVTFTGRYTLPINLIRQYLTGQITLSTEQEAAADINGDGRIDIADLIALMQR
ncbi:MAG: right-handed parallel beta-helix repeat-containing protein [Candidatus Sumerlaeota bacterium]|nr:right-handed parallel beta-helix repeat-containing protein [Candidatus Sumerlaeota bacterium]